MAAMNNFQAMERKIADLEECLANVVDKMSLLNVENENLKREVKELREKVDFLQKENFQEDKPATLDTIINFGIPHVGEQIFSGLGEDDLIQCLKVSQTWKVLATNVLLQRWKGKMFKACERQKS